MPAKPWQRTSRRSVIDALLDEPRALQLVEQLRGRQNAEISQRLDQNHRHVGGAEGSDAGKIGRRKTLAID